MALKKAYIPTLLLRGISICPRVELWGQLPVNSASGTATWTSASTVVSNALPTASSTVKGGIKVGSNLSIDASGLLSAENSYTLPVSTDTILGGIKIGANLNVTADGTLSANSNPSSFIIKQEKFVATEGQTIFNLTKGSYEPNSNRMFWYWNRVKQTNDAVTESSPTSITLCNRNYVCW